MGVPARQLREIVFAPRNSLYSATPPDQVALETVAQLSHMAFPRFS